MLVLIPETVNGKPFNLITLGELVKAPKEGHATEYCHLWKGIIEKYRAISQKRFDTYYFK